MTTRAIRQTVKTVWATLGRLKPSEVLENAGLIIVGKVAPRLKRNQLVDQMTWVSTIL
jgi:hypothetical protein